MSLRTAVTRLLPAAVTVVHDEANAYAAPLSAPLAPTSGHRSH